MCYRKVIKHSRREEEHHRSGTKLPHIRNYHGVSWEHEKRHTAHSCRDYMGFSILWDTHARSYLQQRTHICCHYKYLLLSSKIFLTDLYISISKLIHSGCPHFIFHTVANSHVRYRFSFRHYLTRNFSKVSTIHGIFLHRSDATSLSKLKDKV